MYENALVFIQKYWREREKTERERRFFFFVYALTAFNYIKNKNVRLKGYQCALTKNDEN